MNPISDVSWSYTPTQTFQHWLHLAQIERVLSEVKWTSCSKCCMITLTWRVSRGQVQNDRKQNGGDKSWGRWEWVQQAQVEKLLSLPRWALQNSADGNLTVWGFPKNTIFVKWWGHSLQGIQCCGCFYLFYIHVENPHYFLLTKATFKGLREIASTIYPIMGLLKSGCGSQYAQHWEGTHPTWLLGTL